MRNMTTISGYDVSTHQAEVDHAAFKRAGYSFCYVKATEGVGYEDPRYQENVKACQTVGVPFGSYHFARVSLVGVKSGEVKKLKKADPQEFRERLLMDAVAEAQWHAQVVRSTKLANDLPCVLDIEWDKRVAVGIGSADVVTWCRQWLREVAALTERRPVVYTGRSFWRYKLAKSMALADHPLWQADYSRRSNDRGRPKEIDGWPAAIWQRSGSAPRPDKVGGKVDDNVWMLDKAAFLDLADGTDALPAGRASQALVSQPVWARAIIAVMQRFAESARADSGAG